MGKRIMPGVADAVDVAEQLKSLTGRWYPYEDWGWFQAVSVWLGHDAQGYYYVGASADSGIDYSTGMHKTALAALVAAEAEARSAPPIEEEEDDA